MCYSGCLREDFHGECMYQGRMKDEDCHCYEEPETEEENDDDE